MAGKKKPSGRGRKGRRKAGFWRRQLRLWWRYGTRLFWALLGLQAFLVFLFGFATPPMNFYQWSESRRLGGISQEWVALDSVPLDVPRALIAAEDAGFCQHWGFDLAAIRAAVSDNSGRLRGASTITQQVAKNVFLWPARSWLRKALEAETTLMIELFWSKRRIVEVYMNVAEFDEGVFGVQAAARRYFGKDAADLTLGEAALLAAVLPDPKRRSARNPTPALRRRAAAIADGARTLERDGRADCLAAPDDATDTGANKAGPDG